MSLSTKIINFKTFLALILSLTYLLIGVSKPVSAQPTVEDWINDKTQEVVDVGGQFKFQTSETVPVGEGDTNVLFVVIAHYRSQTSNISGVVAADLHDGVFRARERENEYTTEIWTISNPQVYSSYDFTLSWDGEVEDVVVQAVKVTGVNLSAPISGVTTNSAPSNSGQNPRLEFAQVNAQDQLVLGGVTSYTGDGNEFTPISTNNGPLTDTNPYRMTDNTLAAGGTSNDLGGPGQFIEWSQSVDWHWSGAAVLLNAGDGPAQVVPSVLDWDLDTAPGLQNFVISPGLDISGDDQNLLIVIVLHYRSNTALANDVEAFYNDEWITFNQLASVIGNGSPGYVTEIFYQTVDSLDQQIFVEAYFDGDVGDPTIGIVKIGNVSQSEPVSLSDYFAETYDTWGPHPDMEFLNVDPYQLIFGAAATYSGNSNTFTPLNSQTNTGQLWNQTDGSSILFAASAFAESGYQQLGWEQSTEWDNWGGIGFLINGATQEAVDDETPPEISFSQAPTGVVSSSVTYAGTATDTQSDVVAVRYSIPSIDVYYQMATATTGSFNSINEPFLINLTNLPPGWHTVIINAEDAAGNFSEDYEFTIFVDIYGPDCEISNFPSPTDELSFSYIGSCYDENGVGQIEFNVYHVVNGVIHDYQELTGSNLTQGSFGDSYIEFEFTTNPTPHEGPHLIHLNGYDTIGNLVPADQYPIDRVVVEKWDTIAPNIYLNLLVPNPTIDNTPHVNGVCADDHRDDTNSNIASFAYRLNGGSWQEMAALDGSFDSPTESFSERLDELSLGEHLIEVRCADASSNSTHPDSNGEIAFEVVAQDEGVGPDTIVILEEFSSRDALETHSSDAIWGGGKLRLKESITYQKTALDTTNFAARYGSYASPFVIAPSYNGNFWYQKSEAFYYYDIFSDTATEYLGSTFGISDIRYMKEGRFNGRTYLFVSSGSGLLVYNVTDNQHTLYQNNLGYDSSFYVTTKIELDFDRGRMGAYLLNQNLNTAYNSKLVYVDFGTNPNPADLSDDTIAWIPTTGGFPLDNPVEFFLDSDTNQLYVTAYDTGLIVINDNNTPTHTPDDQRSIFSDGDENGFYWGFAKDDNNNIFLGSSRNGGTHLSVLTAAEGEIEKLISHRGLWYLPVWSIDYIPDQTGVGDQFILNGGTNLVYYNPNNTLDDDGDDTLFFFDLLDNVYPLEIKDVYVYDYNTIFVTLDRAGLYRIDLERNWEDNNQAIAIARPDQNHAVVNNVSLEEVIKLPDIPAVPAEQLGGVSVWSNLAQAFNIPLAHAQGANGVSYYISVDDGITWDSITLGEILQYDQYDYRIKFKMVLSAYNNASPVIDAYTLRFGGYTDELETTTPFGYLVEATPNTMVVNNPFSLLVQAVDVLGYPVSAYSGEADLTLRNFPATSEITSGLSHDSIDLVDGAGQIAAASINKTGDFSIHAVGGSLEGYSGKVTVTSASQTLPSHTFTSSRYTINKGDSAILSWNVANSTSASIDQGIGSVPLSGQRTVSPSSTTTYTLSSTGPNGDLTSSLTIIVNQPSSSGSSSSGSSSSGSSDSSSSDSSSSESADSSEIALPILVGEAYFPVSTDQVELTPTGTEEEVGDGSGPVSLVKGPLTFNLSFTDLEVERGEKVRVEWDIDGEPDSVFIDYLGYEVSSKGHFEFFAQDDTTILITATKDGQTYSQILNVIVRKPGFLGWLSGVLSSFIVTLGSFASENLPLTIVTIGVGSFIILAAQYLNQFSRLGWKDFLRIVMEIPLPHSPTHTGMVLDDSSRKGIAFAHIMLISPLNRVLEETVSNRRGQYHLTVERQAEVANRLKVVAPGFTSVTEQAESVDEGDLVDKTYYLHRNNQPITLSQYWWTQIYPKISFLVHTGSALLLAYGTFHSLTKFLANPGVLIGVLSLVHGIFFIHFAMISVKHLTSRVRLRRLTNGA